MVTVLTAKYTTPHEQQQEQRQKQADTGLKTVAQLHGAASIH
jgi:hypothetical protein